MAKIVDSSEPSITITLVGDECYGLGELLNRGISSATSKTLGLDSLCDEMQKLHFGDKRFNFDSLSHIRNGE